VIMLSTAFIPAVTAIPAASVTTTEMQVCGGGNDGDLSCNWDCVAGCAASSAGACVKVCEWCVRFPSWVTCGGCAGCLLGLSSGCIYIRGCCSL